MSNEEFETYLALVGRLLRLSPPQREQIGEELRDHMELRVADLVAKGMERKSAVLQAVEEFGDAAVLAENLKRVSTNNRRRWIMRFATLSTVAMFAAIIFAMAMWPGDARFGQPSRAIAQDSQVEEKNEATDDETDETDEVAPAILPSKATQANEKVRKALAQTASFEFDETPFMDIHDELQTTLGINILLTESARDDSLAEDEPITCNLQNLPYSKAIRIMLAQENATYVIKDGILKVISLDDAHYPKNLTRKLIDVSHLLTLIEQEEEYATESLIDVITNTVDTYMWMNRDKRANQTLSCVAGVLILNATESSNERVENFLTDMTYMLTMKASAKQQAYGDLDYLFGSDISPKLQGVLGERIGGESSARGGMISSDEDLEKLEKMQADRKKIKEAETRLRDGDEMHRSKKGASENSNKKQGGGRSGGGVF